MDLKNKKILMLSTTDNMIWQFLIPHIKHLESLGAKVECACSKTGFWFDELKDKFNFTMHEIDFARSPISFKNLNGYKKLKKLQKENKYDLIYCQQPVGGLMGRLIGKKYKLPVIYTAHGFHFYEGCSFKSRLVYKTVEKWLSKYTHALITINDEDFEAAKKMRAKHVFKINGIGFNNNKYNKSDESKSAIRKDLGLGDDEFVITIVAEFIKRKNYPTILNSVAELKKQNEKVKLLICGRGQLEDELKSMIRNLNIEDCVSLLGYRKDINRILIASDVFTIASFQEGLTLSVIEAMSFGLPCVVSNVRGNRDLIVNGEGGYVVDAEDYIGFAEKFKELKNDKKLCTEMGLFNKKSSNKYSIDAVKEQLEKIYEEI